MCSADVSGKQSITEDSNHLRFFTTDLVLGLRVIYPKPLYFLKTLRSQNTRALLSFDDGIRIVQRARVTGRQRWCARSWTNGIFHIKRTRRIDVFETSITRKTPCSENRVRVLQTSAKLVNQFCPCIISIGSQTLPRISSDSVGTKADGKEKQQQSRKTISNNPHKKTVLPVVLHSARCLGPTCSIVVFSTPVTLRRYEDKEDIELQPPSPILPRTGAARIRHIQTVKR